MSFIGGIIQSIFTDIVKDALLKPGRPNNTPNKHSGCSWLIAIGIVIGVFLLLIIIAKTSKPSKYTSDEDKLWKEVKIGDSLFVNETYGIHFHKKARTKLSSWEQRDAKYAREDTIEFVEVNRVDDRFFFKNKTSFIGICTGVDSTIAKNGRRWLKIKPSNAVTHPPRKKNQYDYETRTWDDKTYSILHQTKISKEFYVSVSDVSIVNQDKLFK